MPMRKTFKWTITRFVKITLLLLLLLESVSHFRHRAAIDARIMVARDGSAKVARRGRLPLFKPRYTRWWRALLLLGRYRLTRLP